jgi:hypothetical protein
MTLSRSRRLARLGGFLAGLGLAVWGVALGRVPEHTGAPDARVTMATKPTQKLLTEPAGRKFLTAGRLEPGPPARGARGRFTVKNLTRNPMSVALAARAVNRDLDHALQVEVSTKGKLVFRGSLGRLRSGSGRFGLAPSELKRLDVRAWLPPAVGTRHQGRFVDVRLKWRTRAARS